MTAPSSAPAQLHADATPHRYSQRPRTGLKGWLDNWAKQRFFTRLIKKTNNFDEVRWLGHPVWQNVLDLFTIQQVISDLRPDAIIETGTNRGGSSLFFAHLLDLLAHNQGAPTLADGSPAPAPNPDARIFTIDIQRLHSLAHPRITYQIGSSVDDIAMQAIDTWLADIAAQVAKHEGRTRPLRVFVILDSDHSAEHVGRELDLYTRFIKPPFDERSILLCQDGVLDTLPLLKSDRAGPLVAINAFLKANPDFTIDQNLCSRFLITHHPSGWLRFSPPTLRPPKNA
jgi:cephalosporin hydroxylase